MAVVEYKLHALNGGRQKKIPDFIQDGGHWFNSADNTLIGWVPDDSEYYTPDTLVTLTKQELVTRVLGMHAVNPMTNQGDNPDDETTMTDAEVTALVEAWFDAYVEGK